MPHPLLSLLRTGVLLPSYLLVLLIRLFKWLIAPPALVLQLLFGVPLTLLRTRQPLWPQFFPIQESELPNTAWIFLSEATQALAAEGFITCGDFRCNDLFEGGSFRLRLLAHPAQGMIAMAVHIEMAAGVQPARQFIEFSTGFQDQRLLVTNNLDLSYSLPAPPHLVRIQLKDVWDPRALYVLHRGFQATLSRPIDLDRVTQTIHQPAEMLTQGYTQEIHALTAQGWLRREPKTDHAQLRPWAALTAVWRQAWPLASLYLRAADRHSRRLLAQQGLNVDAFTGSALTIVVSRQPLVDAGSSLAILSRYAPVQTLAYQTDPVAVLESVVVELDRAATELPTPKIFHYSFRSCEDHPQRRIRRLRSFDIVLDTVAGTLAVTAMKREVEQAPDDYRWTKLAARSPRQPLLLGPWLCDLDAVLPTAQRALAARAETRHPMLDAALLYLDHRVPHWQIVAWIDDKIPLAVAVDARSGTVLKDLPL